jgi:peptide deformylase
MDFNEKTMSLEGDLSELLQHEYDHLDGILATMRAIDGKSLCLKSQRDVFIKE